MTENETVNMRDVVGIVPYEYLMTENESGNKRDDVGIVPYDLRNINKQKMLSIINRQQTKIKTGG